MGGMSILSQQLVLGPFASPGRKQQAEVLMHFSRRNCCYSFVSRPPTGKTEKGKGKRGPEGESRNEEKEEEGGEEKGREKREISMNCLQEAMSKRAN